MYIWRIKRGEKENCPSCLEFNGTTRTLENWLKLAIPGQVSGYDFGIGTSKFPYGVDKFGTYCEADCQCSLKKIGRAK